MENIDVSVSRLGGLFPDEDAAYRWLEAARWDGEPVCPHCGGTEGIRRDRARPHYWWHKGCRRRFSVLTGTCLHATKRPLRDWMHVLYSAMTARRGVSVEQLAKELGVQHRTAWFMLERIREASAGGEFELGEGEAA